VHLIANGSNRIDSGSKSFKAFPSDAARPIDAWTAHESGAGIKMTLGATLRKWFVPVEPFQDR
jgi:hypothetical protein